MCGVDIESAKEFLKVYGRAFMPEFEGVISELSGKVREDGNGGFVGRLKSGKVVVFLSSIVFGLALDFIGGLRVELGGPLLRIINEGISVRLDVGVGERRKVLEEEGLLGGEGGVESREFLWGELAYEVVNFNDDDSGKKREEEDEGDKDESDGRVLVESGLPLRKHRVGEGKGLVGKGVEGKEKMGRKWADVGMGVSVLCYTVSNTKGVGLNCAGISSDGSCLAGGFGDSLVRVWDAKVGVDCSPTRYVGHGGGVYGVGFSPCGKFLISGASDGGVRLWRKGDKGKQGCLIQYGGHSSAIWDVEFAKYGTYFVTGGHDRTAKVWSTERSYPLRILAGHLSDVDCVAWHPNCGYIATGSGDGSVRVWDIRDGNCIRLLNDDTQKKGQRGFTSFVGMGMNMGIDQGVTAVAWEMNGRRLASAKGATVQIWDTRMGKVENSLDMPGGCWSLAWAHEGGVGDISSTRNNEADLEEAKNAAAHGDTAPTENGENNDRSNEKDIGKSVMPNEKANPDGTAMEIEPAKGKPNVENSAKDTAATDKEAGVANKTPKATPPRKILKRSSAPPSAGKKTATVVAKSELTKEAEVDRIQSVLAAGGPLGVKCWNATTGSDMGMWKTKNTPIQLVRFNRKNLLIALGAYGQY